jgi:hypothetical protein
MEIIPNQHFRFLAEQRARADKEAELSRQQLKNIALTDGVNKAFNEYTQDKNAEKFTNKMRTLGIMYGNDRLQAFEMPWYMTEAFGVNQQASIPAGMEVTGYDQKGQPMIRKAKRDVAAEKLDIAKEEKLKQKEAESQLVKDSAQDTLNTISEVEKGIKYFGAAGQIPPLPAEYEKKNWKVNVDKLRSKIVVDLINRMKQASRTGATGFGQLSDKERLLLENAATALRTNLSEEDAMRYLGEIKRGAQKVLGISAPTSTTGNTASVNTQFVEGKIYRDKSTGERAMFLNGAWVDPVTRAPLR